jgi:formylglycine-generating enzyme
MSKSILSLLVAAAVGAPWPAAAQARERAEFGNFELDRTEVTAGQFRKFAEAEKRVTAAEREGGGFEWGSGWERRPGWTVYTPFGEAADADEPAVHVSWFEAESYCRWAGGRLPTAAEWQNAAYVEARATPLAPFRQGSYRYPSGETPAGANTNGDDPWPRSAPAGATAPGVNGLYDMGGNVWEWVADAEGETRRTMGGSWWYGADQMTREVSAYKPADFYAVYVGFRCAYELP